MGGSVESLVVGGPGKLCGQQLPVYPPDYSSAQAGLVGGRVLVCGGNSGYQGGKYRVHNSCYSAGPGEAGWVEESFSLPVNTTNAAYTVWGGNLYILGGYQLPACGYRPGLQIYLNRQQRWTANSRYIILVCKCISGST